MVILCKMKFDVQDYVWADMTKTILHTIVPQWCTSGDQNEHVDFVHETLHKPLPLAATNVQI